MGNKRKGGGGGGGFHRGRGEDITSARGQACVIATCNVAREREASRELVTLLTQMIEKIYPAQEEVMKNEDVENEESHREMSAEDLMKQEIEGLKAKGSTTQVVVSLQTGVKGVVFVKIRKQHICPVRLVQALFKQVADEGLPLSRHLVRVVPLQRVFFPDEQELTSHIRALVGLPSLPVKIIEKEESSTVDVKDDAQVESSEEVKEKDDNEEEENKEDGVTKREREEDDVEEEKKQKFQKLDEDDGRKESVKDSASITASVTAPLSYNLLIKIRNHDTLKKNEITHCVTSNLPRHRFHYNYKVFKGMFIVNIFKNIAGISLVEDYESVIDFNIAKHQDKHCAAKSSEA